MNFPTLQFTDAGKAALIKALDGEKLEFTRIAIGNGDEPDDIAKLTIMQNEILSAGINAITKKENSVTLETSFDNSKVNCYYAHEIGVFARNSTDDETGSEVLYAYAYSGDTADYIPESTTQSYVKTTLNIIVAVGEAENVSAVLSEYSAYADKEAFEAHVANTSNPHNVTKEQIGLSNVENLSVSDGVPDMETSTSFVLNDGDKMSTLFGKLKYAMTCLLNHLNNSKNPHNVSCSQIGAAKTTHTHKATDITSGTLPITRGGTGTSTTSGALDNLGAVGRKGTGSNAEVFNATSANIASGNWSHAEGYSTEASGNYSHAEGYDTEASGDWSHAEGWKSKATSYEAHAEGYQTTASELGAHSEGRDTEASGGQSHAEGYLTKASGGMSHAEGYGTEASGNYSHAAGICTVASETAQTVVGSYNESADGYFIVGCGGNYTSGVSRENAFRVNAYGWCFANLGYKSSGADFAEMFEWADGNPENEDRRGLFVTLDGDKIRLANAGDNYILGVVSAAPTIVGNTASEDWQGRFKTDVFGERLTETVTVPEAKEENGVVIPEHTETHFVLNEDYDDSKEYVPREQRKEWAAVGLVGQLVVVDDGTCKANGYCTVGANGKATANQTGYRVMTRLDDDHIRIIYRAEV